MLVNTHAHTSLRLSNVFLFWSCSPHRCWNEFSQIEIWVMPLWVAPFPFREKSKSLFPAHAQSAWDNSCLLLLSLRASFTIQVVPIRVMNNVTALLLSTVPPSPHTSHVYLFSDVTGLWEHLHCWSSPRLPPPAANSHDGDPATSSLLPFLWTAILWTGICVDCNL